MNAITELENWLKLMDHDPADSTPLEDAVVEAIEALKACERASHVGESWEGRMKRLACFGAATIANGDMRQCQFCQTSVAWDLVDHGFFGFKASCPMKAKS